MSWLVFEDLDLSATDVASETSHLVFEDDSEVTVETEVAVDEFVVFDAQGQLTSRVEDEVASFVIFTDEDTLALLPPPPSDGSPSLTVTTGVGPKGDKGDEGDQGEQGEVGPDSTVPGPQGEVGPASTVPGPQGEPGADSNDASLVSSTYIQPSPAAVWVFTHDLNYIPAVSVVDSAGTRVEGEIAYLDAHSISITFAGAFAGAAYLS